MKSITMNEGVFIIAELSANHNGNIKTAISTIQAAAKCGANAIKLQTYTPDTITLNVDNEDFKVKGGTLWDGRLLYELYQEAYTPWEWHRELFHVAHEEGLLCFSSPFDKTSVDFLETLNTPIYKIASFEITDIPLIQYAASKGKPMILSTGIATFEDIDLAVRTCRLAGNDQITLLKCTSSYPAPMEEANLTMIPALANDFKVKVGLSDHTPGWIAPVVATALGATVIEKHFILDRNLGGPDADFSLNVEEFTQMVDAVRLAEQSMGKITYDLTPSQAKGKNFARSLYVVEDIHEGELFSEKNIKSIRPGFGLHPKYFYEILGQKSPRAYKKGDRLEKLMSTK